MPQLLTDSTPLRANGGVWHKQHRLTGEVPHTSIDTEAIWRKSGYHGWWYGWKLPLAGVVGSIWLPLAAEFTIASDADHLIAPKRLEPLPLEACRIFHKLRSLALVRFCCAKSFCCINTSNSNLSVVVSKPYYERTDL